MYRISRKQHKSQKRLNVDQVSKQYKGMVHNEPEMQEFYKNEQFHIIQTQRSHH